MSYAIIETGGKQVRVEPGRFYDIELLPVAADESVTINNVLLVQHNGDVTIGQPFVEGATVEGTVMRHFRGRKVIVYKMKPKKKTRKKRGHRQEITRLMIDSISMNGTVLTSLSTQKDETSVTEPQDEAPVTEEVAVEATPAEETTAQAPATEEAASEAPATEETAQAPTTEEVAVEASVTEETAQAPTTEEVAVQAPTTEESAQAPTTEESSEAASQ